MVSMKIHKFMNKLESIVSVKITAKIECINDNKSNPDSIWSVLND